MERAKYLMFQDRQNPGGGEISRDRYYFEAGMRHLEADDHHAAIELFSMAADINPDFGETYGYRGFAYYAQGMYQEAMDNYNMALSLDSSLEMVYFFRGVLYCRLFRYEEAIDDLTIAIGWDNDFDDAYCYRGMCKWIINDQEAALRDLRLAGRLGNRMALRMLRVAGYSVAM